MASGPGGGPRNRRRATPSARPDSPLPRIPDAYRAPRSPVCPPPRGGGSRTPISLLLTAWGGRRRHEDDAGGQDRRGSLMRHILVLDPIPRLPGRMVDPPPPTPRIPSAGGVEGRAPCALGTGSGAVPIPAIAHAAEKEHLLTVGTAAAHESERVHGSLPAARKGVDTREDLWDSWAAGRAGSRPRGSALGSGGVEPPGPHPLGALVGIDLPYVGRSGQPALFYPRRLPSRIPHSPEINDILTCRRPCRARGWRATVWARWRRRARGRRGPGGRGRGRGNMHRTAYPPPQQRPRRLSARSLTVRPAPAQDSSGQQALARLPLAFGPTRRAVPGTGAGVAGEAGPGLVAPRPRGGGIHCSYASSRVDRSRTCRSRSVPDRGGDRLMVKTSPGSSSPRAPTGPFHRAEEGAEGVGGSKGHPERWSRREVLGGLTLATGLLIGRSH
jgi:hypothetical protein